VIGPKGRKIKTKEQGNVLEWEAMRMKKIIGCPCPSKSSKSFFVGRKTQALPRVHTILRLPSLLIRSSALYVDNGETASLSRHEGSVSALDRQWRCKDQCRFFNGQKKLSPFMHGIQLPVALQQREGTLMC